MKNTQVKELMEKTLMKISPDDSLYEASKKMKDAGCGCLAVGTRSKLEGVITDRDIVIRAIAEGRDPTEESVRDYMSPVVKVCRDNDTLAEAAKKMRDHRISRLVVMDNKGKPCGVLSFGKILRTHSDPEEMTEVIAFATGRKDGRWSQDFDDAFMGNEGNNP